MKERIIKIMEDKDMSPSVFADKLNIGRAVLSHILTGRNKASIDVIMRILETFDDVNSEWLLFGKGEMYKKDLLSINNVSSTFTEPLNKSYSSNLFSDLDKSEEEESKGSEYSEEEVTPINTKTSEDNIVYDAKPIQNTVIKTVAKDISKIIIYYSDNTFQAFNPDKSPL